MSKIDEISWDQESTFELLKSYFEGLGENSLIEIIPIRKTAYGDFEIDLPLISEEIDASCEISTQLGYIKGIKNPVGYNKKTNTLFIGQWVNH